MTDEPAGLGFAARALLDGRSSTWSDLDQADVRDGVLELVAAQQATYLEYDMPEIDIALVRALRLEVDGIDARLVSWLTEQPSTARLGVVCRALRQLWSPVEPHASIEPGTVRMLLAAGATVAVGEFEIGAYRSALGIAARELDDASTVAAINEELARRTAPDAT